MTKIVAIKAKNSQYCSLLLACKKMFITSTNQMQSIHNKSPST